MSGRVQFGVPGRSSAVTSSPARKSSRSRVKNGPRNCLSISKLKGGGVRWGIPGGTLRYLPTGGWVVCFGLSNGPQTVCVKISRRGFRRCRASRGDRQLSRHIPRRPRFAPVARSRCGSVYLSGPHLRALQGHLRDCRRRRHPPLLAWILTTTCGLLLWGGSGYVRDSPSGGAGGAVRITSRAPPFAGPVGKRSGEGIPNPIAVLLHVRVSIGDYYPHRIVGPVRDCGRMRSE